jgi:3-oxoacyl-[acyl-carrier-protein] synthase-3
MNRAKIVGIGAYVPKRILTNHDLEAMVETSDQWIIDRTGIRERHIADETEVTSDLAAKAATQALDRAGILPEAVDLIVCATSSADMLFPSTAIFTQQKIGAKKAAAFDLWATCSGSLYSLSVGSQYIQTGQARTVLCIGAEILSRYVDYTDRTTCIVLADAAGAVVLRSSPDESGLIDIQLGSDGEYADLLYALGGGTKHPPSHESLDQRLHYIKMKGSEVFKIAVRTMEEASSSLLAKHGLSVKDVSLFIPHQANLRIIQATAKRVGLPMEQVVVNIDRYGNTGAASLYVAMEEAHSLGRLKSGDLILMAAFGGGLTWGAGLIRW